MGSVLDILTGDASFFEAVIYRCKRYTNSWVHLNAFESTLISVNELDAKR